MAIFVVGFSSANWNYPWIAFILAKSTYRESLDDLIDGNGCIHDRMRAHTYMFLAEAYIKMGIPDLV